VEHGASDCDALALAFPPELSLSGCGAGEVLADPDGSAAAAKSFPVQDLDGVPGIQCPGCVGGVYTIAPGDWKEVLGLVYAGLQRDGTRDCNGDVRRSLVASWGALFPSGCGSTACPSLRRAWRPGDLQPGTAALLAALGLTMPPARGTPGALPAPIPLCNAHGAGALFGGDADYLDRDPIRVECGVSEQVCSVPFALGLVTAIQVPRNLSQAEAYPTQLCGVGQFAFVVTAPFQPPPNACQLAHRQHPASTSIRTGRSPAWQAPGPARSASRPPRGRRRDRRPPRHSAASRCWASLRQLSCSPSAAVSSRNRCR
jgi:hypothetical protein